MHSNNIHNQAYDFPALISAYPLLKEFVFKNSYDSTTIDFGNPKAVIVLNKAILIHYYQLKDWSIPKDYLCPPIPGRADYIHHIADLLNKKATSKNIKGLDIGVGANCIYPILGTQIYNWQMVGVDINEVAVASAKKNIAINPMLTDKIAIRHQTNNANIFEGIIQPDEYFHFTMCNPPFHSSQKEAEKHANQKIKNLKGIKTSSLNFGGQSNELWCNGGEALFIKRMIKQSTLFAKQVGIFSCLVSKSENLTAIKKQLLKLKAQYHIINMEQGNKKSRIVAWTFNF